jgi:hypothetical protein
MTADCKTIGDQNPIRLSKFLTKKMQQRWLRWLASDHPQAVRLGGNNAQVFQLPMSLPQESLLSPVEVPVTDSEYLFKERL